MLELARIGYKYGLEPPNIIKIEKEIEIEKEEEPIEEDPPIIEEPPPKPKPLPSAKSRPLNLDEEVSFKSNLIGCFPMWQFQVLMT